MAFHIKIQIFLPYYTMIARSGISYKNSNLLTVLYYDCPKFNKLSVNSNTDLLLLNFNIRSIGANFDTFNCFTNLLNKKFVILSFSESWLNDNNKNLYTIEGYYAFHNLPCDGRRGGGLSVYISNVFKSKVIQPCTIYLTNHWNSIYWNCQGKL